eukprot:TRINITY_DN1004_c0_g2_i2.p1 TRINITY_DN1004_c0_g2~~TRINITY_DN1004_c0_g2_i2.p1  ORF type:complete len:285 (+),score=30.87 TRINITY_DN1004_c0_g2_i2:63-917(+)
MNVRNDSNNSSISGLGHPSIEPESLISPLRNALEQNDPDVLFFFYVAMLPLNNAQKMSALAAGLSFSVGLRHAMEAALSNPGYQDASPAGTNIIFEPTPDPRPAPPPMEIHEIFGFSECFPVLSTDRFDQRVALGSGTFGNVFRACDRVTKSLVAIKSFKAEHLQSDYAKEVLVREVRVACRLQHTNVMKSYFSFQDATGQCYLVSQYIEGRTLLDCINSGLNKKQIRQLARQLIKAINYLSKQGVTHRDLKPENILVSPDGHLTVTGECLILSCDASHNVFLF